MLRPIRFHTIKRMFGSGRAILSLRDDYRRDLREVKQATGFDYIRFHAIFDDKVGVYEEDSAGSRSTTFRMWIKFTMALLEMGVRPR